jgi:hypothetical protein
LWQKRIHATGLAGYAGAGKQLFEIPEGFHMLLTANLMVKSLP